MDESEIETDSIIKRNENILETVVSGELLLFNPSLGSLYETNEVGAIIWKMLDGKNTCRKIIGHLEKEYGHIKEVGSDLHIFLKRLLELDLARMV